MSKINKVKAFFINPKTILAEIFLVVFIGQLLSPVITSFDSRWSIHTAVSIISEGNTNLDEYKSQIEEQKYYAIRIVDGHYYTMYPVGASTIAVPFVYAFDKTLSLTSTVIPSYRKYTKLEKANTAWWQLNPDNVISHFGYVEKLVASVVVALNAVFIFLIASLFLKRRYSLLIVFIFAFCTSAWSTAGRALWQHGPSMLMLSIALYLILLANKRPGLVQYVSLPLAFAYVIRPTNIISVVLLTIFILVQYRSCFLKYIAWSLPIALPFIYFNFNVWHSFLPPYYLPSSTMSYNYTPLTPVFYETLVGNLISPNRGLFVFTPIFLFCLYGTFLKIKNKQIIKLDYFLIAIVFFHWITISTIPMWGDQFGPRLFTDMIPYFIYFLLPIMEQISGSLSLKHFLNNGIPALQKASRLGLLSIFSLFIGASFFINLRGATDWNVYRWNAEPVSLQYDPGRIWDWHDLQFLRGLTPDLIEWQGGFSTLEGTSQNNWRWSSQQGTIIINNSSHRVKTFVFDATFATGYPELSNLNISGDLIDESLKISSAGYNFRKEIIIPPGKHIIEFTSDAVRVVAPNDPRCLIFSIKNFQMTEENKSVSTD
ncbi:MAG: hypothetical protein PHT07_24260 [Paludibacter sp.]|nr:hypothetical protein [Paludibacter sp.]